MNPEEIGSFLEPCTYENLLEEALDRVPEGIDIREGSIIYDALAPACYQLADYYMQLKAVMQDSFVQSAIGDYLDLKVSEFGLTRFQSTQAIRIGHFEDDNGDPFDVPLASRFSSIETTGQIYRVTERISNGVFYLRADESGTAANSYHGDILPVDNINGLSRAILGEVATPGQNEETDDALRERFFNFVNQKSFGGNFSEYVTEVNSIDGVGGQQIYPVWNGGGTVKVVIIDSELNLASSTFISHIKEILDPQDQSGEGAGLAPIGHKVTVVTADRLNVDIEFDLSLMTGYTLQQIRPSLLEVINNHFLQLRTNWSAFTEQNTYQLSVYRSQILAALIGVQGVANVENMRLNGDLNDIDLLLNNETSQLPFVQEVNINES